VHTVKLRPLDKWLLALIFLILSASTIAWTLADKTPPAWDPADHIMAGYDYYFPLAQLNFAAFNEEFFKAPHSYAPFVHLVTAVVFLLFGASRVTGIAVNLISLAALLLSVSWIARTLHGEPDDETNGDSAQGSLALSVLAPLLATSYHFAAWLLHDAFLDYPLMAMVSVSFAMLIRADRFQLRGPSLIFGLSVALGMLTKQTFLFFMFLPALYVTIRVIAARDARAILNLVLAGLVAIAIAAVWYGPHLDDVIEIYRVNKQAAVNENEAPLFTFRSNLYYPHALLSTQIQLPLGLLFLAGLIYSLARRGRRSVLLYLWLFGGIGAFILVANKDPRYTVPVLPAAALISVSWLARSRVKADLKQRRLTKLGATLKPAVVAGAAAWALVSFFNAQWPRDGMGYYIDTPDFRWMVFARNYFTLDHHPGTEEWAVPDIVRSVVDDWQRTQTTSPPDQSQPGEEPVVGVVVNLPYLNPSSIALYARLMTRERGSPPLFKVDWVAVESARDRIQYCDFIVVRTGLDRAEWVAPMERYIEEMIRTNPDRFVMVRSFRIPIEGAEAVLYRKREGI
jgi:4-amino-4-deoxy-L-arabinose transferase-like glycosyltransferase